MKALVLCVTSGFFYKRSLLTFPLDKCPKILKIIYNYREYSKPKEVFMKKWVSVLLVVCIASAFGQAWFIEKVDTTGDQGPFSSLIIDSDGIPHIAYMDATNGFLKYAFSDGTTWTVEVADNNSGLGGVGFFAAIDIGSVTGRPEIVYYDMSNTHLKWARRDPDGTWFRGTPDPNDLNDVGQGCDIVMGEEAGKDIAHISYYDATANLLMYARPLGTAGWARDTVDSVGPLPIFGSDIKGTSITLDGTGVPHIAYYAWDSVTTTGFLKHAYLVSGNWVIDTVERVAGNDVGNWPDIAITDDGLPYISYFDNTNGHFRYARWTGTEWTYDLIDNTPGVGMYGSQEFGSTHVSYYDASNGNLKWGYSEDYLGWHTEEVDTAGDVGRYTSIALTHEGDLNFPHISYYDATNGDLKYATFLIKDVLPTTWWLDGYPPDLRQIHPDSTYTPVATVRNQGNTPATFDVQCEIFFSGFRDHISTKTVGPLNPNEEATVTFDEWIKLPHVEGSWYHVQVRTLLPDDSLPANDTIFDSLYCTVGAVKEKEIAPTTYELSVTGGAVMLALPALTDGELYVLDVVGRRRLTLHEGNLAAGVHEFKLDESALPSGVYFIKFSSPAANLTRKTVFVR